MLQITLSQAVEGYTLHAHARRLSQHTIDDYLVAYKKLINHLGPDTLIASVTTDHLTTWLSTLTTLSAKTVLNHHVALSALWAWAVTERLCPSNLLHSIPPPRPDRTAIVPFSESDCRALVNACSRTRTYTRPGKAPTDHALPNPERTRAIVLLLLDTGLRVSELCSILIHQVDLKNRQIIVMGKGRKQRIIPFSSSVGQCLWRYLSTRPNATAADPLIASDHNRPLDRGDLAKILTRLGARAGVPGTHAHRFRHTFAITYLRNGGDVYSLQTILGHSSLDMTRRYLAIAQVDLNSAHRRASPVENWGLGR